jgi:hypothetical protein
MFRGRSVASTTADVERPLTFRRNRAQNKAVIVGIVVPAHRCELTIIWLVAGIVIIVILVTSAT